MERKGAKTDEEEGQRTVARSQMCAKERKKLWKQNWKSGESESNGWAVDCEEDDAMSGVR